MTVLVGMLKKELGKSFMCGIAGFLGIAPLKHRDAGAYWLRRRGPDSNGQWNDGDHQIRLEHVRLAILDRSSAGSQPMISHDGRVVMVYNGEIYNYVEIKKEIESKGYCFKSNTDSEVLLEFFSLKGSSCFKELNGIFSAAFWERDKELLTIVRDPVGVKPLYYTEQNFGIAFSSEMKSIIRSENIRPSINPIAVLHHLGFLWSPGSETVAKGISKLLPGHFLRAKKGKVVSIEEYKEFKPRTPKKIKNFDEEKSILINLLTNAVESQMISDVPLGAFLSGGLDSSAVVTFAQRFLNKSFSEKNRQLQCFSIDIADGSYLSEGFSDDLPFAKHVARHLGVDLHLVRADKDMMHRLPEMIYFMDEPAADPAALNTLLISELARKNGIKVLLSGAGGDDIFTGYRRHYAVMQEYKWAFMPRSIRTLISELMDHLPKNYHYTRRLSKAFHYAGYEKDFRLIGYFLWLDPKKSFDLLDPAFREAIGYDVMFEPMLETLKDVPNSLDPVSRMLYLERRHFLADHNLNYTDKMGMAAGVEIRVPLLDHNLINYANSLPTSYKQRGRVGKWLFKKAMEDFLPNDVIYRPKTGFGVPLRFWLRGILRPLVDDVFSATSLKSRGVFNVKTARKLLEDDLNGRIDASYSIFSIICLELWCRQFIDGSYAVD